MCLGTTEQEPSKIQCGLRNIFEHFLTENMNLILGKIYETSKSLIYNYAALLENMTPLFIAEESRKRLFLRNPLALGYSICN